MGITNGVFIEHGGADSNEFWDATFTRPQLAYAEVETERNGISVAIDAETGEASLNAGYIEDSPEGRDERSLWAQYEDLVVEALDRRIALGEGNDAFKRKAADEAAFRRDSIAETLVRIESADADEEEVA